MTRKSLPALFVLASCLLISRSSLAATPELPLWPGTAPGSEQWKQPETVTTSPSGDRIISNVSKPTLTVFLPDSTKATGTAA